nr:putative F-box protein At1g19160 [Ipomoea batatas]
MDRVLKMGNYKLPMDLVIEILARLPVKSLMRFKCVCKFFYDLIKSDNQFKDKHYGISKAKSDCVVLETGGADVREYFFVHRESESNEIGCTYLDIPKRPIHWIKCCQGMLCMISSKTARIQLVDVDYLVYDILIWNPSTRKVKALPSITFPNKLPNGTLVTTEFGFGISNDMTWKVVMLLEIGNLGEGERKFDQITMVYSQVHSDSWSLREINSVPFVPPVQGRANDFYLKGRYYWNNVKSYYNHPYNEELLFDIDHYKVLNKRYLIWFDMDDEVFGTIELPSNFGYNEVRSITIMNETIALVVRPSMEDSEGYCIDIWLMIENDNNTYWHKQACIVNIDHCGDYCRTLGIWNVGSQLLVFPDDIGTWDWRLFLGKRNIPYFISIDLVTREKKTFYISRKRKSINNIDSNVDGYLQVYNERNIDIKEEWKFSIFMFHSIHTRVFSESLYLL